MMELCDINASIALKRFKAEPGRHMSPEEALDFWRLHSCVGVHMCVLSTRCDDPSSPVHDTKEDES